jgi:hypothetical protein
MTDSIEAIDFIKRRIAQAKLDLARVTEERKKSQQQELVLMKEVQNYEAVLAAEQRRGGTEVASAAPVFEARSFSTLAAVVNPPEETRVHPSSANPLNATQAIHDYIRAAGTAGITRKEIRARLLMDGIRVHNNYPYVVLGKLKEANKIREDDNERLYAL